MSFFAVSLKERPNIKPGGQEGSSWVRKFQVDINKPSAAAAGPRRLPRVPLNSKGNLPETGFLLTENCLFCFGVGKKSQKKKNRREFGDWWTINPDSVCVMKKRVGLFVGFSSFFQVGKENSALGFWICENVHL